MHLVIETDSKRFYFIYFLKWAVLWVPVYGLTQDHEIKTRAKIKLSHVPQRFL